MKITFYGWLATYDGANTCKLKLVEYIIGAMHTQYTDDLNLPHYQCDQVCQWLAVGGFLCITVSSTNKTDHHDITEILLKVVLNIIHQST